jgi:hypothetical protein
VPNVLQGTLMAKFVIEASPSDKTPKRRRDPHDASLLFSCMDVLQIDHSKLARDEPLLYRELQGICALRSMACAGTSGGCTARTPQC